MAHTQHKATPPPVPKKGGLLTNFDEIDQFQPVVEKPKTDEAVELTPIPIEPRSFQIAYLQYIEKLHEKPATQALLREPEIYSFNVNRLVFTVTNAYARAQLNQLRDEMIPFLRQHAQNPTIIMDVLVDESRTPKKEGLPLTKEEIKAKMEGKNPHFQQFQQLFGTTFIY